MCDSRFPSLTAPRSKAPARPLTSTPPVRRAVTALTAGLLLAALSGCGDPGGGGGGGYVVGSQVANR